MATNLVDELLKLRTILPSNVRQEIEKLIALRDKYVILYNKYDDLIKIVMNGELLAAVRFLTGHKPLELIIKYKETLKHIETLKVLLELAQKEEAKKQEIRLPTPEELLQ